jgi:hypothetical protein
MCPDNLKPWVTSALACSRSLIERQEGADDPEGDRRNSWKIRAGCDYPWREAVLPLISFGPFDQLSQQRLIAREEEAITGGCDVLISEPYKIPICAQES